MGSPRHLMTERQMLERDAKVARLVDQGVDQALIAERLGVSRGIVKNCLARHRLREKLREFDRVMA